MWGLQPSSNDEADDFNQDSLDIPLHVGQTLFHEKNRWNPESSARCCADTNLTKLNLTAQEILKALCHTMPVFFGGDVFRQK